MSLAPDPATPASPGVPPSAPDTPSPPVPPLALESGLPPVRWPHLLAFATCAFFVLVLYANSIHGPPQFDDRHTFALQTYAEVKDQAFSNQFPQRLLVNLTFLFNYWLGGQDTFGYHLLNMGVHLLTGFCLFGLLYDLLRLQRYPLVAPAGAPHATAPPSTLPLTDDRQVWLALVTTLVFVCHPLATQSVSYIVQRYSSIASLFCVLAVWAYCRARRLQRAGADTVPQQWLSTVLGAGLAVWAAGHLQQIPRAHYAAALPLLGVYGLAAACGLWLAGWGAWRLRWPGLSAVLGAGLMVWAARRLVKMQLAPWAWTLPPLAVYVLAASGLLLLVWGAWRLRRPADPIGNGAATAHLVWYAGAIVAGLAAMFSKEFPIALPGMILLVELVLVQRQFGQWAARLQYALPVMLTALAIPLIYANTTISVMDQAAAISAGGAANGGWAPDSISRWDYLKTQCEVIPFTYLRLTLLPMGQSIEHSVNLVSAWQGPAALGALLIGLLLVAAVVACRWAPFIGVGLLWLLGTLVPTSSLLPNHILVAEHRMYLPLMGVAFILVGVAEWRRAWWDANRLLAAATGLLLVLSITTIHRNRVWADSLLLWQDTARKAVDQPRAHFALGYEYEIRGRYAEALAEYDEALRESPRYSDARHNRGNVLQGLGRREDAVEAYKSALEVEPERGITWGNMAVVLGELGRHEEALAAARHVCARASEGEANPAAHYIAGLSLQRLGRLQEARDEYLATLRDDPHHLEAKFNLGLVAYAQGDRATAMTQFTEVVRQQPDHAGALIGYGTSLADAGQLDQAATALQQAAALASPQRAEAWRRLGQVRSNQHDWPAAITALKQAAALAPKEPLPHLLLADAYTATGDTAAAAQERQAAQALGVAVAPASVAP